MITPMFYMTLVTHLRQRDQAVGVEHATDLQAALYRRLDASLMRDGARHMLAGETKKHFDKLVADVKKSDDLQNTLRLRHDANLCVAILENVANG